MKKIFLSAFALLLIVAANAQNDRSSATKTAVGEPLVNGIPYSQYKAQQEALKQAQLQKAAADKAATTQSAAVQGAAYDKPTPAQLKAMQPMPVTTKPAEVTKVVEPTVPSRLVGTSATSADMPAITAEKPATTTVAAPAAKNVSGQYADKTIPGTLVQAPALTVGTVSATEAIAAPVAQTKLPEVKVNQSAQQPEAEIPASVAPTPIKTPVVGKQGGN